MKNNEKINRILEVLLALSISVLPWSNNLNSQLLIFLFLIAFIDVTFFKKEIKLLSFNKVKLIIIPYFVFILGVFWSSDTKEAFKELTAAISLVVIPFIFVYFDKYYKSNYHIIFIMFIFSCILKYFIFLFHLLDFHPEAIFSLPYWKTVLVRLNRLFYERSIHPTYFSLFMGISIYLASYLSYISKRKWQKFSWGIVVLILLAIMISLMAKMPILSLIVSLLTISIVSIIKKYNRKRLTSYLIGFSLIVLSLSYYLYKVPNTFIQDYNNYKNLLLGKNISDSYDYSKYGSSSELESWKKTNRIFLWQSGIQVWKDNWFIGTGTGDYKMILNKKYKENGYLHLAEANMNTHNQYLSYIVQYGILGFVILLCLILILVLAYKSESYLFAGVCIFILGTFFTENILERQWGIVCFSFFTSLLLLKYRKKGDLFQESHQK